MLFNTLVFWAFFLLTFSLYFLLRNNLRRQNILLLLASYIFYGYWDWRFLSLILSSTILDYLCGIKIYNTQEYNIKKRFLILSVVVNLTILGCFKYFNFFMESTRWLLQRIGLPAPHYFLKVALPIGISFYTFQTMSYTIDIYRGKMAPTKDFLNFALFVSFFPQLVAGPIERARHLLPQILQPRKITPQFLKEGVYLITWGLYKKVVVADNLALIVEKVFSGKTFFYGSEVLISLYSFALQVYGDFSGYSDIARGLGRLMGFDIMLNFNLPYFSRNVRELWRRWHISLSTWLRDYLYISLGGNRKGRIITCRNLMITMLLGGLWHGAGWNFVIWGFYWGMLLIIHRLFLYLNEIKGKLLFPRIPKFIGMVVTFHLICYGCLMFRSNSLDQIIFLSSSLFSNFHLTSLSIYWMSQIFIFSWLLILVEVIQYKRGDLDLILHISPWWQGLFYLTLSFMILLFGVAGGKEFVYFQF